MRDYMDMRVIPPKRGTTPTCNPRQIQLGHPVLYPYSEKTLCSLPPLLIFFASDMQQQQQQQQQHHQQKKLYLHDHKGIAVLQKLLV